MRKVLNLSAPLVLGALAALALPAAADAQRGPPPVLPDMVNHNPILYADLGLGGPGQFTGVLDQTKNQMCYMIEAPGLDRPTGAAITDAAGKTVLKLAAPVKSASGGCIAVPADLGRAFVGSPANYKVELSSAAYPDGSASAGVLKYYDPNKK